MDSNEAQIGGNLRVDFTRFRWSYPQPEELVVGQFESLGD